MLHKAYRLYVNFHPVLLRFPKQSRYSLGVKIDTKLLELLEMILLARSKRSRSRLLALEKADRTLALLRLLIRAAHDTQCIKDKSFVILSEQAIEIGKMLGGWIQKEKMG